MNRSERTVKMQRFLVHAKAPLTQQTLGRSTDALGVSRIFLLSAVSIIGLIFLALSANNARQHRSVYERLLTDGTSTTATVLETKKKRRSTTPAKGTSQRRHAMLVTYEFRDMSGILHTTTIARWLDERPLLRQDDRIEVVYDPRKPQVNAPREGLERRIYGQHGAIWWLLPLVALYLIVWLLHDVQWRWRRPPSSGSFNIWSNA